MNRFRFLPVLIAGLALALAACDATAPAATAPEAADSPSGEPSQAESAAPSEAAEASEAEGEVATVRLSQFAFDTDELTIAGGTEVTFVNADAAAHTVTEGTDGVAADDPIIDEELGQNASTSFTFDEAGTYEITCLFHPSMNMTIVVE
jgi:plastocyanin